MPLTSRNSFNPGNRITRKHCKSAYRSGLEEKVSASLKAALHSEPLYERFYLEYSVPSRKATYTPDFILPNGIIIETKGRFIVEDRQKHLLIKEQHPELDIRFVFTNSKQKLYKGSKTSYASWCEKYGFLYADKQVPEAWLKEPASAERTQTNRDILKAKERSVKKQQCS